MQGDECTSVSGIQTRNMGHSKCNNVLFFVCAQPRKSVEQPSHISDGLLFGVVQIRSSMIGVKVDETLVANSVVFRPRHRAVSVLVELRESFLRVL